MDNGWEIKEAGFNSFDMKNEIFFHRVAAKYNELTNSSQYDAIRVRSDAIIRPQYGKDIGIVIRLSTLVETLPNKSFLTPTGILVASHGVNVDGYDKRLVIPASKFHAIQIGTNAHRNPGVSYLLNELSKKDWSDQANLILAQLSIPDISTEDIKWRTSM